jgi:hypothetical protein
VNNHVPSTHTLASLRRTDLSASRLLRHWLTVAPNVEKKAVWRRPPRAESASDESAVALMQSICPEPATQSTQDFEQHYHLIR